MPGSTQGFLMSEEAVEKLRKQFEEQRQQVINYTKSRNAPTVAPDPEANPSFFVARTPDTGIPGLLEASGASHADRPGFAECDIYRIVNLDDAPELVDASFHKTVYNISHAPIGGNRWIKVDKDGYGAWIATPPSPFPTHDDTGTGLGIGTADPGEYGDDDVEQFVPCGIAIFPTYRYRCEQPDAGTGTGQTVLNEYLSFVIVDHDENGCIRADVQTEQLLGAIACCDDTCADTSDTTGTGTAGGGGGTPVESPCCPGVTISSNLRVNFNAASCTCYSGSENIEIVYDSVTESWKGDYTEPCGGGAASLELWCDNGTWFISQEINGTCAWTINPASQSTYNCDPFIVGFNGGLLGAACPNCPFGLGITVTE